MARASITAVGADAGSSLLKLALRDSAGQVHIETRPLAEIDELARYLDSLAPAPLGLTGSGAARLSERLRASHTSFDEAQAWAAGARGLRSDDPELPERFLLVSVGTGTFRDRGGARARDPA